MKNNEQIKKALRNQFKEGTSKMAKRICYGYVQNENGSLIIDKEKAEIIKMVFESYLSGYSLGVPSQQKWTQKSFKKRNESQYFVNLRKPTAFIPRFA